MKYLQSNVTDFESWNIAGKIYYKTFYSLNSEFYYGVSRKLNRKLKLIFKRLS